MEGLRCRVVDRWWTADVEEVVVLAVEAGQGVSGRLELRCLAPVPAGWTVGAVVTLSAAVTMEVAR